MTFKINDQKLNYFIKILKKYSPEPLMKPNFNSENIWRKLIIEICVRGGSRSIDRLKEEELEKFLSQFSLEKMPLSYDKILKVLNNFSATRFRPSAAKTILENYKKCFSGNEFRFISLLKENIPEKDLTKGRIEAERRVRNELRDQLVWVFKKNNEWKVYNWKNKPISDWLIDVGFAIALMPFDSRVRKILKKLGINVTNENYENVEDFFIRQICPRVKMSPCQIDRILYKNSKEIISLLNRNLN